MTVLKIRSLSSPRNPKLKTRPLSVLFVHGFAVNSWVFQPLLTRLQQHSLNASLFRYPSVGLPLLEIVDRLVRRLRESPPDAIIAHSLGCMVTGLAVRETGWTGPVVLLAPPFCTLPLTKIIPQCLRWPFRPLLDHRTMTTAANYQPPIFKDCRVKTIAGRLDIAVPVFCSKNDNVSVSVIVNQTHNSMLFSSEIAKLSSDWIVAHRT